MPWKACCSLSCYWIQTNLNSRSRRGTHKFFYWSEEVGFVMTGDPETVAIVYFSQRGQWGNRNSLWAEKTHLAYLPNRAVARPQSWGQCPLTFPQCPILPSPSPQWVFSRRPHCWSGGVEGWCHGDVTPPQCPPPLKYPGCGLLPKEEMNGHHNIPEGGERQRTSLTESISHEGQDSLLWSEGNGGFHQSRKF